jgi:outer membrane assembly lipoprotein YfiO
LPNSTIGPDKKLDRSPDSGFFETWRQFGMKFVVRYILISAILLGAWGCGQKSAKLQKSVSPPDKTLFETGSNYLNNGQYIKARLAYQNLIQTYADSDFAAEAYFAIADSYYDEGGTENLLNAEEQYANFIIFFPTHPKAVDAMIKNISLNMKMMHDPDRDQQYAYKALKWVNRTLEEQPDSDFAPIVRQYKREIEETLALGDLGVARFYADKNNIAGEKGRIKTIIDNYPDFSRLNEVYFEYAGIMEKFEDFEEAAIYYKKIISGMPFSKHYEEAKQRLLALNKPVPAIDENLVAFNKSKLKTPKGVSLLKPFIDFGSALGVVQPKDRYQEAKKTVQDEKVKAAQLSGGQGDQSNDALINVVISKTKDGETQDTVVLGPSGDNQPNDTDNKKKKTINKNKRQSTKKIE